MFCATPRFRGTLRNDGLDYVQRHKRDLQLERRKEEIYHKISQETFGERPELLRK
jgi:hypothetical protein